MLRYGVSIQVYVLSAHIQWTFNASILTKGGKTWETCNLKTHKGNLSLSEPNDGQCTVFVRVVCVIVIPHKHQYLINHQCPEFINLFISLVSRTAFCHRHLKWSARRAGQSLKHGTTNQTMENIRNHIPGTHSISCTSDRPLLTTVSGSLASQRAPLAGSRLPVGWGMPPQCTWTRWTFPGSQDRSQNSVSAVLSL